MSGEQLCSKTSQTYLCLLRGHWQEQQRRLPPFSRVSGACLTWPKPFLYSKGWEVTRRGTYPCECPGKPRQAASNPHSKRGHLLPDLNLQLGTIPTNCNLCLKLSCVPNTLRTLTGVTQANTGPKGAKIFKISAIRKNSTRCPALGCQNQNNPLLSLPTKALKPVRTVAQTQDFGAKSSTCST